MDPIWLSMIMGILAGICRSILGYAKNSVTENFDWGKLFYTVIVMAFTGFVIGFFTPDWKLAFALSFTGGVAVNELVNTYINIKNA